MRTLKEEIAYQQLMGYHRNTIELSQLISWLEDRAIEDSKIERLKRELLEERHKVASVNDTYAIWKLIPSKIKEVITIDHLIAVLAAVTEVVEKGSIEIMSKKANKHIERTEDKERYNV